MADPQDRVEISWLGDRRDSPARDDRPGQQREPRPWLSIWFNCCRIYARIYRNREATAYVGWCPRCGARVQALIGPDGTDRRLFETT